MALLDADISRLLAEEFFHKFWHPLLSARARVDILARSGGHDHLVDLRRDLDIMTTMLQRAQTNNWLLKADGLAQIRDMRMGDLIREIHDTMTAVSTLADHPESARYEIDRFSFDRLAGVPVWTDARMLRAALGNILDNARKYSFDGTTVRIRADRSDRHRVLVEIINVGIALQPDEVERCRERGWRSETARRHTEKGLGVGLWLTDRMLRAIDAELLIFPTDAAGFTRVVIGLPVERPSSER